VRGGMCKPRQIENGPERNLKNPGEMAFVRTAEKRVRRKFVEGEGGSQSRSLKRTEKNGIERRLRGRTADTSEVRRVDDCRNVQKTGTNKARLKHLRGAREKGGIRLARIGESIRTHRKRRIREERQSRRANTGGKGGESPRNCNLDGPILQRVPR